MKMTIFASLAFRNLLRNRTRTLITLSAISFGCIGLILVGGFFEDTFLRLREGQIHSVYGHLQVHKQGFSTRGKTSPFDFLLENPQDIAAFIKDDPNVALVTPRIGFSALLSTGETTYGVFAQGVDPKGEDQLATLDGVRHAEKGIAVFEGQDLEAENSYDIIVGKGLADTLNLKPSDTVTLLVTTVAGGLNALDLTVQGIFFSASEEFDDRGIRIPIRTAQSLLRTDEVQTLVVCLRKTEDTDRVLNTLRDRLTGQGFEVELIPWYEMADFYRRVVELYRRQFHVLIVIVSGIVILSIFNSMNMTITERTREIGTIMALGYRRSEIQQLFVAEGFFLGLIGGLLGLLGGILSGLIISTVGIPMPPPPGGTAAWTAAIEIKPYLLWTALIVSLISSIISSFYPARKAAHLVVAEALRHV